jgi:glycosyltransferase involved in cell wall biosynthesis
VFLKDVGTEDIRLLRRALRSVREQEFRDGYEMLVLDDGSTVPVEDLAPTLGRENLEQVRFVRNKENRGLVYTLNRGISEARNQLIARLDADDRWLPTKIQKQLDLFESDDDLTIAATGMTTVTPQATALRTYIRPGRWTGILTFCSDVGCPFPHGSVIARRDIYRLLGGYSHHPTVRHCEDFSLWSVWLRFFKPAMIEEALYDYTVSAESVSILHRDQQGYATQAVIAEFRSLGLASHLPSTLQELASAVKCSVLEAGILAYRMWRFGIAVRLPPEGVDALRRVMPDRVIVSEDTVPPVSLPRVLGRQTWCDEDARASPVRAM